MRFNPGIENTEKFIHIEFGTDEFNLALFDKVQDILNAIIGIQAQHHLQKELEDTKYENHVEDNPIPKGIEPTAVEDAPQLDGQQYEDDLTQTPVEDAKLEDPLGPIESNVQQGKLDMG